jgi:hypothetical protein
MKLHWQGLHNLCVNVRGTLNIGTRGQSVQTYIRRTYLVEKILVSHFGGGGTNRANFHDSLCVVRGGFFEAGIPFALNRRVD